MGLDAGESEYWGLGADLGVDRPMGPGPGWGRREMFCFSSKSAHPVRILDVSSSWGPLHFDADLHHRNERPVFRFMDVWTFSRHMARRKLRPAERSLSNQAPVSLRVPSGSPPGWTQGEWIGGSGELPQGWQAQADDGQRCDSEHGGLSV